jgi:serine/threonine protein kinase
MTQPPRRLGRYEILSVLGTGSMGIVYRARDMMLEREVALKTLYRIAPSVTYSGSALEEKVLSEARLAGKLKHPHIVRVYEVEIERDTPFIAMDVVDGQPLDQMIKRIGRLPDDILLRILEQIASALDYAHSQGVLHRDIKPANILVDDLANVFIVDFGVAAMTDVFLGEGGKKKVVGSAAYMSPEQIQGQRLSPLSDLFSLAVVAFEALTGSRPFPGSEAQSVMRLILDSEALTLLSLRPELPQALEGVFKKALSKDDKNRFSSGSEFIEALEEAFQTPNPLPKVATPQISKREMTEERAIKRLKHVMILLVASCFIVAVALATTLFDRLLLSSSKDVDDNFNHNLLTRVPDDYGEKAYTLTTRRVEALISRGIESLSEERLIELIEELAARDIEKTKEYLPRLYFYKGESLVLATLKIAQNVKNDPILIAEALPLLESDKRSIRLAAAQLFSVVKPPNSDSYLRKRLAFEEDQEVRAYIEKALFSEKADE